MNEVALTTYKGWAITVREDGTFFALELNPQPGGKARIKTSEKLTLLKKAIDSHENIRVKAVAAPIALPVVVAQADPGKSSGVITGISLHNHEYLGAPDHGYGAPLYPDTPWIRKQTARILELQSQIKALVEKLSPAIVPTISYFNNPNRKTYAENIENLRANYTKALLAAEELAERDTEEKNSK